MTVDELSKGGKVLARKLLVRLAEILAREFPTDSPQVLGSILQRLINLLIAVLDKREDERVLKFACGYLQELSSHLRYIEGAGSSRIPTAIISPLETLIRKFEPGARVMVRVQSSYNYTVFDIVALYKKMFGDLLRERLAEAFGDTSQLYVIGLPSVEYSNVLLHAILCHEIGHRLAAHYLEAEDQAMLVEYINGLIGPDLNWWDTRFEELPELWKLQARQKAFKLIYEARTSALKELISDAIAYYVSGLSAVFAMEEFSASDLLDEMPEEGFGFYPPWRYRLRQLVERVYSDDLVKALNGLTLPYPMSKLRDDAITRLVALKAITDEDTDMRGLDNNPILKRAYSDVPQKLIELNTFLDRELPGSNYSGNKLLTDLPELLERLCLGIPPDQAVGKSVDIRSALIAGWLYRGSRSSIPFDEEIAWEEKHDEILTRLVLKAVESIQLLKDFKRHQQASE